jgi:hypothetical protein
MDIELDDLLDKLRNLEEEFEQKVDAQRAAFQYRLRDGRVEFEESIIKEHRRIRKSTVQFLRESRFIGFLISPFVYILVVPFVALDLGVWLFQRICFFTWGIVPVRRADYVILDRRHLAYLNGIEKMNCLYCSYANGLIAYVREVASKTEQYWCPIKHAVRTKAAHARYHRFLDYGDAEAFHARLEEFRTELRKKADPSDD